MFDFEFDLESSMHAAQYKTTLQYEHNTHSYRKFSDGEASTMPTSQKTIRNQKMEQQKSRNKEGYSKMISNMKAIIGVQKKVKAETLIEVDNSLNYVSKTIDA